MKLFFIPFTLFVVARFPKAGTWKFKYLKLKNLGIWCCCIGPWLLANDYRKLNQHMEELQRLNETL